MDQILRKPAWLKVTLPGKGDFGKMDSILARYNLNTVCQSAQCPNQGECWGRCTSTIMILGEVCTRNCKFCAVDTGNPKGFLDWTEPERVAGAVKELGLDYVVITSVDRDDLEDGGAELFAATIRRIKETVPGVLCEPLIPDFFGRRDLLEKVIQSSPDVLGHNLETVRRLTPFVRDRRAGYDLSLKVLTLAKEINPSLPVKSGIMLGLGETDEEVLETLRDIRNAGADIVTLGQYLMPTRKHLPVQRYVDPETFRFFSEEAYKMGFKYAPSAPLVRSSYHAEEFRDFLEKNKETRE